MKKELLGLLGEIFDERQMRQIHFSVLYDLEFGHGADGHNSMKIIAKFYELWGLLCDEDLETALKLIETMKEKTA